LGLTAALPTAVEAVNTCNTFAAIDYTAGPNFGLQGDTYRVKLSLFTGSVTGGTKVTVDRVRFNLDCTNGTAGQLACTDLGAIISYTGDATITTDCPTGWTTANAANSTSPNQVVLTASTPFDIPANTGSPSVPFCEVEFDVKIANLPSPAQTSVAQTAGFDQTQSDGACDNTLKATGTQSGSINLCPTCTNEECNTVSCNQAAGTCTVITPSNEGNACTGAAGTPNSCQREVCRTGTCVIETNPGQVGQACTFGTPVTNAECQQKLCAADGTCPVSNFNEGGTCDNASPAPNTCQKEICQSGVCNSVADAGKVGQACTFGTPVTNAECQQKLCAADGTCPVSNFNEGGTCDNASPPPTNPECQEQVCQSGACVVEDISPPPAVCVPQGCPTAFEGGGGVSLGAAGNFAILVLDSPSCSSQVILSAPATEIDGKVVICSGVTGDILKLKIDGKLLIQDDGSLLDIHSDVTVTGGIVFNADAAVSEACGVKNATPPPAFSDPGDCRDASTTAAGLACTQTLGDVTTSAQATFTGNGGVNVICINNVNLVKQTITFNGTAADRFIINISGPGVAGVQIFNNVTTVLNGVEPKQILWNVTAPGTTVSFFKPGATLAGTWLVPDGSFIQDHGRLDGTVCAGCTAKFHSGAVVSCPDP
jgi:hypothetical protein